MDYPKCNHYLTFNRISHDSYQIKDFVTKEEWEAPAVYADFLKSLDGTTDPYEIDPERISEDEVDHFLEYLEEEELLEDGKRWMYLGLGSFHFPLWIPKVTSIHRIFGAIWNKLLMITWIPLLVCGGYVLLSGSWEWVDTGYGCLKGYPLGLILGLLLHEFSHAFACIGYSSKNHFFEMGITLQFFLLPGAYVMIDYSEMKNRFKRAQINTAGVECNVALCGIFLCCLKAGVFDSAALITAAILNLILALVNTSMVAGVDGMRIFSEIFSGREDLLIRALELVLDQESRNKLRRRGINGKATIAVCYIIVMMQVLLPLILLMTAIALSGIITYR